MSSDPPAASSLHAPPPRIPLRREPRPRQRITARHLAASVAAHAALGALLALLPHPDPPPPATARAREAVDYLDLPRWPGTETGSTPHSVLGAASGSRSAAPGPAVAGTPARASRDGAVTPLLTDPAAAAGGDTAATGPAPGAGPRTQLGPAPLDPRLVVPPPPARALPSDVERHLAAFMAALRPLRDSLQDAVDRERRVASWTWTDPDGRAWGVRNGVLYVAGNPATTVEIVGERDQELARRAAARQRTEILRQAEDVERDRCLRERARLRRRGADGAP